jgi:hypothetical protein
MEVYGHEKTEWLNLIRKIRLEYDMGKWHFEQFGTPFPFEETERYQAKRKTERFDFQLLKKYLIELGGLLPFEEDFYLPAYDRSAILVQVDVKKLPQIRDVSLMEARRLNNIED